jgi:hypothetical protein
MPRLRLRYRSSINKKAFTIDDEIDDSPLLKVEYINDFYEKIPPDVREKVAMEMLKFGLKRLEEEAENAKDRHPYNPAEGF